MPTASIRRGSRKNSKSLTAAQRVRDRDDMQSTTNLNSLEHIKPKVPCQVYGQVAFDDTDDDGATLSESTTKPYIRVSHDSDPTKVQGLNFADRNRSLVELVQLCQLLVEHWDLKLPRFVISVTGMTEQATLPR